MREEVKNNLDIYLPRIKADIKSNFFILGSFFLVALFFRFFLKINLPFPLFFIVAFLFFYNWIAYILSAKGVKAAMMINLHFFSILLDVIALAMMVYYLGGILWISPFFYSVAMVNLFWLFPKKKAFFLNGACLVSLLFVIALQYFKKIPDFYVFPWSLAEENAIQNLQYFIATATGSLLVILTLGFSCDVFRRTLELQIAEAKKAEKRLRETKEILEIEVKNRTADLVLEKKRLEEEVFKRTKEIEGRHRQVREKVKDLENFHQIAVEREIKMIKMKEKISELKKKNG